MKKVRRQSFIRALVYITLTSLLTPAFCGEPAVPTLTLKHCSTPPLIDAELDDPCWKDASEIKRWNRISVDDKSTPDESQKAYVCGDNQWLYIAFDIHHPAPSTIVPVATKHDGRIQIENCVKILFSPGTDFNPWYIFRLSSGNIKADQRNFQKTGEHQQSWDIPWRSATRKNDHGWTAEIALPLYSLYETGKIDNDKTRLDLIISSLEPLEGNLDNIKKVFYSWSPVRFRYWDEPNKFGYLKGLDINKIRAPFLPQIKSAELVGGYKKTSNEQLSYTLDTTVTALTGASGKTIIRVKDIPAHGTSKTVSKEFELKGGSTQSIEIDVPVDGFSKRDIQISLVSASNGETWQTFLIENPPELNVLSCFSRYSYYTTEKDVQIVCDIALDSKILSDVSLTVKDTNEKTLANKTSLTPSCQIAVPLDQLPQGTSRLNILLSEKTGALLGSTWVNITKLSPSKGSEVKIDRASCALIRNGQPFIPFGIYGVPDAPDFFKAMHEADMNFAEMQLSGQNDVFQYQRSILRNAGQYDIQLAMRPYRYMRDQKLSVADLIKGTMKKTMSDIVKGIPSMSYDPATDILETKPFDPLHFRLPVLRQKLGKRIASELYNRFLLAHLDFYSKIVETCKDYPATLCYMLCDEPVLPLLDEDKAIIVLDKKYKEIDPYHPSMINYCGLPPDVPQAISIADIISADTYGREVKPSFHVAHVTSRRCSSMRKVPWVILETRNSLRPDQQTAQCYASIIGGIKGFQYFIFPVISKALWNNLSRLATEMKSLTPFITTPPIQQKIHYTPGDYSLDKGKIPDVVTGVFKSDDGRYLLLLVNCVEYPVDVDMTLPFAVRNANAKCLRTGKTLTLSDRKWAEKLEKLAVRSYVFDKDSVEKSLSDDSFNISVAMKSYSELAPPQRKPLNRFSGDKKNMMVNTSMETTSVIPDWPDYYIPINLKRAQLEEKFQLDTENPFHGKQSLKMSAEKGETFGFYIIQGAHGGSKSDPYLGDPNIEYTLSVYMKSDGKGAKISMKSEKQKGQVMGMMRKGNVYDVVKPPTEWTRYSWKITMPALLWFRITGPGTVWIDAFQLEKSDEPTEYEPQ